MPDWMRIAAIAAAIAATMAVSGAGCRGQASAPAQFERDITLPALSHPADACAVLDGNAAAYAARGMTLWADTRPVPFALTVNSPDESANAQARIANFQSAHGVTNFDLLMPARSYSSVALDLASPGAIWRARLSLPASGVEIGRYLLFDLSNEHGPISTTMAFTERSDRVLHVALDHAVSRSDLRAAWVSPSRSAQTLFTTIATVAPTTEGQRTVAEFLVAQDIPVERVQFEISGAQEFRRRVTVNAMPQTPVRAPDTVEGTIQQIHATRNGAELNVSNLSLPAVLPDNARSTMRVTVAVDNAGQPPLPIRAVELQMRQRKICFAAWPGVRNWRLFYGSPTVEFTSLGGPPRSMVERANPIPAQLGPEKLAADFHPLSAPAPAPRGMFWLVLAMLAIAAMLLAAFLRIARIPHIRR